MKPNENRFIPFSGGVKHLQNIFVEILMEADLMKRAESFEIELRLPCNIPKSFPCR